MRESVSNFTVTLNVLFECPICGAPLAQAQTAAFCVSTRFHCQQCGACYIVNWKTPANQGSVSVEMVEEKDEI